MRRYSSYAALLITKLTPSSIKTMKYCLFIIMSIVLFSEVSAKEGQAVDRPDIQKVIDHYSNRTKTKFVIDPRVRGKVNMVGLKLDEIGQEDLNNILLVHNVVAYKKGDVVYIVPIQIEAAKGKQLGEKWVKK